MTPESGIIDQSPSSLWELFRTSVLALSVAGLCYYCYFLLAPWIWSRNIPFNPADITPWILEWTHEHDGIEIYALYILMFVNSISAVALSWCLGNLTGKRTQIITATLCISVSCVYCAAIGFTPPMSNIAGTAPFPVHLNTLFIMAVVFSFVALLYYLQQHSSLWPTAAVFIVLVPACFIATEPISWDDYTFIFTPALRLLKGAAIRDIYFQYDLLPSLFAAIWMKIGVDLNTFQVLGQAGYYAAIMGVFLLSKKLFYKKDLAFFLVTALILGRLYASPMDIVSCFQVTPLRLDFWLPLLVIANYRGPYHWSVGLVCGLFLLLLKTFGIIYTLAYIQLLITLFAINYSDERKTKTVGKCLREFMNRCWLPVAIIVLFACTSSVLFRNSEFGSYSGYYQKIGIGFIQISSKSFYWYVPALFSMVIILLFKMRAFVSSNYLASGFLLTYCAIGNSIYFFGRSHEHNILNIAIILIFLLFFLIDLIARILNKGSDNNASVARLYPYSRIAAAIAVLSVIVVFYSDTILKKVETQFRNVREGQLIYPHNFGENPLLGNMQAIRQITNNSCKVYFVSFFDFDCYYYGGYTPVGYCNPYKTWIFTADLIRFMQGLLDNGYYLVCSPEMRFLLANIDYTYVKIAGGTTVVSKSKAQAPVL